MGTERLGKRTLAQVIYNDSTIKETFPLRLGTCVQKKLDAMSVLIKILQAVTCQKHEYHDGSPTHGKKKLKKLDRKYLLILDDVWTENQE